MIILLQFSVMLHYHVVFFFALNTIVLKPSVKGCKISKILAVKSIVSWRRRIRIIKPSDKTGTES